MMCCDEAFITSDYQVLYRRTQVWCRILEISALTCNWVEIDGFIDTFTGVETSTTMTTSVCCLFLSFRAAITERSAGDGRARFEHTGPGKLLHDAVWQRPRPRAYRERIRSQGQIQPLVQGTSDRNVVLYTLEPWVANHWFMHFGAS